MIQYSNNPDQLRAENLEGFFIGWPSHPDPNKHIDILRNSYAVWLALDGAKCVGFITAISDSIFYAYIPLLEVLPDYQDKGIGKQLVSRMFQTLDMMYAIDIVCDEEVAPFYEKLGLSRCVALVKRNYSRQSCT